MWAYINDFIGVSHKSVTHRHFGILEDLLTDLGLPINKDKRTPDFKILTCFGIQIDVNFGTLSIDPPKLQSIYNEMLQISNKEFLSRKAYQSLLDKLLYIHKCVPASQIFINRILELFRENYDKRENPFDC